MMKSRISQKQPLSIKSQLLAATCKDLCQKEVLNKNPLKQQVGTFYEGLGEQMKKRSRLPHFFLTKLFLVGGLLIIARPWAMATAAAAPQCEVLFAKPIEARQLLQAIHNLAELQLNLDMIQAQGTQSPVVTALTADLKQKKAKLLEHLEQHQVMTPEQLRERISRHIARLQNKHSQQSTRDREEESRRRHEQEKHMIDIAVDGTRAVFHRIEPGSFKMGEVGEQVDVTLTKPFEMMATKTTQIIWRTIADLANSRFGDRYDIDVDPSHFKGDTLPVENVSYENVRTWIRALNMLSQANEPVLAHLIPGHKGGDVYRLPTEAEWEFVIRGRGRYNEKYHFGYSVSEVGDHAWIEGNSNNQTHPVASKKPLVLDDNKKFYDMYGNAWEWVHDGYQPNLPGGTDPQGPQTDASHVLRGGSYRIFPGILSSHFRGNMGEMIQRHKDVSFRLVRVAK